MAKYFIQAALSIYNGRNSYSEQTWQETIEEGSVEEAFITAKAKIMEMPNVDQIINITATVSQSLHKFNVSAAYAADNANGVGEEHDIEGIWFATNAKAAREEYREYIEMTKKAFKFWRTSATEA